MVDTENKTLCYSIGLGQKGEAHNMHRYLMFMSILLVQWTITRDFL